jgi:hypothetical protein
MYLIKMLVIKNLKDLGLNLIFLLFRLSKLFQIFKNHKYLIIVICYLR